jgi:hypothetical protein
MKQLFSYPIGSDGAAALVIADGKLKLEVGYSVAAILSPVKSAVIDKLKAAIPGTVDDAILDRLWDELVKALSEAPAP